MSQEKMKDKDMGSPQAFPVRLFTMLEESQRRCFEDVISWQAGGQSFRVFKPDRFATEIAGSYFALRKYKSFLRQLNIYGFQRIHHGPNRGGYSHPLFKRSNPGLCKHISRQGETQRSNVTTKHTGDCGPSDSKTLERSMDSQDSLFEEEIRARYNKLDESVLDPVRLLFFLGSSKRSICAPNRIQATPTTSDSTGNSCKDQDDSGSVVLNNQILQKMPEHSFPWKLHTLLGEAEREGFTHIISWVQEGRAFKVHDSEGFVNTIMPTFFDQSKYESFRRQLNLYGYTRVTRGLEKGFISHPYFRKDNRSLCRYITRKGKDELSPIGDHNKKRLASSNTSSSIEAI